MHRATILTTTFLPFLLFLGLAADTRGGTFRFDLTDAVGVDFNTDPNTVLDLGITFQHIEGASLELEGVYKPGLGVPNTLPPDGAPPEPIGSINLIVTLGDPTGSSAAYALRTFLAGETLIDVELPLTHVADPGAPTLVPVGSGPPDYSFLLDGEFKLHAWNYWLASGLYSIVEEPSFELTKMTLVVSGSPIPEPTNLAMGVVALVALCGGLGYRKRCSARS